MRYKDGNEYAFMSPACPGHRDHLGGGKPPTPKVLTMGHAGTMADPKWEASPYRDGQEWGGAEEKATGGDRSAGKHGDGL